MYQVPWYKYSEEEVQEVLTYLFKRRGYDIYNVHKVDRRGEVGADLECTKPAETDKLLIAVKKKPGKKDIYQLERLTQRESRTKIYVYIGEPSTSFKEAMDEHKGQVSFWNSEKLTLETFNTDTRFYLFLIIENYIENTSYRMTYSFCKIYKALENGEIEIKKPEKASIELLNLLWNAKDRSVSLHRSLRTLQEVFENVDLSGIDEKTKKSIVNGFLGGLLLLHNNSLKPLELLFQQFLDKYQSIFVQFCKQTKGRSNWMYFLTHVPGLLSGVIVESIEQAEKESTELNKLLKDNFKSESSDNLSHVLGDVSQILANGAYWLEDTVDNLLSIAFLGEWTKMREKTPEWLRYWEHEHGLSFPANSSVDDD